MSFVFLFMLFDVMLYVEMSWRNVNNKIYKKKMLMSLSATGFWVSATGFTRRKYLFMTSVKNNCDQENLVADKLSATG